MPEAEAYSSMPDRTIHDSIAVDGNSSDAEGQGFPDDFKKYMDKELSWWRDNRWGCPNWVFWSRVDDEPERPATFPDSGNSDFIPQTPMTASWKLKENINHALRHTIFNYQAFPLLVQFWAPIITDGRSLLTTQNQPFALYTIHQGLCQYRMFSKEYKFYVDGESEGDLGLPGRVFLHKLPESTPSVDYYSSKEYPQRDGALRCHVGASLALPVFEPSGQNCVGVLELVTTIENSSLYLEQGRAFTALKAVGLKYSDGSEHSSMQDMSNNKALKAASDEIRMVLKMVCEVHELRFAQAWVQCRLCTAVMPGSLSYYVDKDDQLFVAACKLFHLQNGHGIVGRALFSHNLIFCTDVTQFSITEYPLAHYARKYGFSGSFAICLQSSYTGNDVYVLEFFLPASNKAIGDLDISLRMILGAMKQFFRTFKLASGEDLREQLPIEFIDFQNGEKFCYVQIPKTTSSPPGPEALPINGVEMMQIDPSDQQSMDPINNGRHVACVEQNETVVTYCQNTGTPKTLERPQSKTGFQISLKDLEQYDGMNLENAAKMPNVSRSTLKRLCRKHGIARWPPRKIEKDNGPLPIESVQGVEQSETVVTYLQKKGTPKTLERPKSVTGFQIGLSDLLQHAGMKIEEAANMLKVSRSTLKRICREHGISRWPPRKMEKDNGNLPIESVEGVDGEQILQLSSDLPDANIVTIKAKYVNDEIIKFPLSLPSRLVELQEQVAKRLHLEGGTYSIKYEDEDNDLILIACDEDLQNYITASRWLGNTSIRILLEPNRSVTH